MCKDCQSSRSSNQESPSLPSLYMSPAKKDKNTSLPSLYMSPAKKDKNMVWTGSGTFKNMCED